MKLAVTFLVLGCFFSGCKHKELSSEYLSNISVIREIESTPSQIQAKSIPTETVPLPSSGSPVSQTRYHVIVSSFGANEKARAERLISQLKAKNYPATLIYSSQRYRVSIESFLTEAEANAARDEYRAITDRQDIWVHKVN